VTLSLAAVRPIADVALLFAVGDVRHGSIKRVATAVGEGAMAIRLIHEQLNASEPSSPAMLPLRRRRLAPSPAGPR